MFVLLVVNVPVPVVSGSGRGSGVLLLLLLLFLMLDVVVPGVVTSACLLVLLSIVVPVIATVACKLRVGSVVVVVVPKLLRLYRAISCSAQTLLSEQASVPVPNNLCTTTLCIEIILKCSAVRGRCI